MNYQVRKIKNNSYLKGVKIENDFTKGPIFKQMLLFALPLVATNVLQIFFNSADVLILGAMVSDSAVAAVGSTGSLVNLIVSMVIGISAGVNVVASRYLGEHNEKGIQKIIGMSIILSLLLGVVLAFIGFFGAKFFLNLMGCPESIIDLSATYLKVYFLGVPLVILYNFLSSIMRASGDSKHPFIYLLISGILNVILNIFFIAVLKMTVEGVAIATVVSQGVSALLCILQLLSAKGLVRLKGKYIRFYKEELIEIIKIGLPAGIQSSLFSLSNVFIQSTINKCGELAMSGSSYAVQIESYVYCAMHSISLALITFVSQNFGAKKIDRIYKIMKTSLLMILVAGSFLGLCAVLLVKPIIGSIADSPEVVDYAFKRITLVSVPYFLCGVMEVFSYTMRSVGRSFTSMFISLMGACVLRIIWVEVMFSIFPYYSLIFITYPITWIITSIIAASVLMPILKKLKIQFENEKGLEEQETA